jgi:hypothetical protein
VSAQEQPYSDDLLNSIRHRLTTVYFSVNPNPFRYGRHRQLRAQKMVIETNIKLAQLICDNIEAIETGSITISEQQGRLLGKIWISAERRPLRNNKATLILFKIAQLTGLELEEHPAIRTGKISARKAARSGKIPKKVKTGISYHKIQEILASTERLNAAAPVRPPPTRPRPGTENDPEPENKPKPKSEKEGKGR